MTPNPTPLDLATLRVITEGATEGPWRIYTVTDSGGRSAAVETAWAHDEQGEDTELVTDWCSPEDAAHIVAFDPPTALALLDRAEAAEKKVAAVMEAVGKYHQSGGHVCGDWDTSCGPCVSDEVIDALDHHTPETETTL